MHLFSTRRLSIGVALLLLIATMAAWGQAGTGSLSGLITDPTGAVINKADITLVNDQTGIVRKVAPSSAGGYTFQALPVVGTYTLTISSEGFREFKASNIVITVGTSTNIDVRLQLGSARETVTVEAGMQAVQTTESQVSGLVDSRIWEQMPLEVRSANSFVELLPGATPAAMAGGGNKGAAINGARPGGGNFLVEGMDNYEQGQGGRGQLSGYDPGGSSTSISPEAIQEYRVITNSFAAEYGKAGGFITDTVLKSGTNNWHGSLFEYNRIQALAANGFFSNRTIDDQTGKKVQDRLVRNQFGGSVGGPILKDRTFFYGSLEFHRSREAGSAHGVSTTPAFMDFVKSGALENWAETSTSGLCNNQSFLDNYFGDSKGTPGSSGMTAAPCVGAFSHSKTMGSLFSTMSGVGSFPLAPNVPCKPGVAGDPCAGQGYYTGTTFLSGANKGLSTVEFPVAAYNDVYVQNPYYLNEYRWDLKFDHKFTDRDQVSYIFLLQNTGSGDLWGGNSDLALGPPSTNVGRAVNTGITWNHTLSNSVLNTVKLSYSRHRSDFAPIDAYMTMPEMYSYLDSITTGLGLYAGSPQYFTDTQFQVQNHLSFMKGKHNFKTGAEYRRTRNGSRFYNDYRGTFAAWDLEDMLTDLAFTDEVGKFFGENPGGARSASASVDPTTGGAPDVYRGFRANEMAAYFQDDWRLTNRLTINWGLRYEYFGPPHNFKPNIDSNFYFGSLALPVPTASNNPLFPKSSHFYAGVATGNFQIRNHEIWNKDTNNFGPRLGFAWDLLGNQKLVMRAGAGVMYDRIYNNVFENIRFNPPYFSDNQLGSAINGTPVGALSSPGLLSYPFNSTSMFAAGLGAAVNPRHMDQNLVSPYYQQGHFGLQWEFANGWVFEPEYIGNFGRRLIGYWDINTFDGRVACPVVTAAKAYKAGTPCANAGFPLGFSSSRINTAIGADNYRNNAFKSNYHGLQLNLRKNYSHGLGFTANYTYAKSLDTLSDLFYSRSAAVVDSMNPNYDYGPSDFDIKNRFVANLSYTLPFMKDNRWIGGWGFNTIVTLQGGVPFSPYASSSNDLNKDGRATDRVVTLGASPMNTLLSGGNAADGYLDPTKWTKYTCPADVNGGLWCNAPIGRNSVYGPGYKNVDFNVTKKFRVTEGTSFTFQANFFNLFNHTNFGVPTSNLSSQSFGKSTTAFANRITQLALRFDF